MLDGLIGNRADAQWAEVHRFEYDGEECLEFHVRLMSRMSNIRH